MDFESNLRLYFEEVAQRKLFMRSQPPHLGVVLTTRCNLRCVMCERVRHKGELGREIHDRMRPLFPYLRNLQWQGGEVFVVDYFKDIFVEALEHPRLCHDIITSGSLLDREWADLLARGNTRLTLSIDSVVPSTYEAIRVGTNLERIIQGLAYLREAEQRQGRRVYKVINAVVMTRNFKETNLLLPFAREHGFDGLNVSPCVPLEDPGNFLSSANWRRYRADIERLAEDLRAMDAQARRWEIGFLDRVSTVIESRRLEAAGGPPVDAGRSATAPDGWGCLMPWQGLFVHAEYHDGDIFPECMCNVTALGNIADTSLVEAWNNERMQEYRRRVSARRLSGWCNNNCASGEINPLGHVRYKDLLEAGASPSAAAGR